MHSLLSQKNTFAYEFAHISNSSSNLPDYLQVGANHEDDLRYVFGYPFLPKERCSEVLRSDLCKFCYIMQNNCGCI